LARLEVVCLTNGPFAENCYVVADPEVGEATLIDPGLEHELFMQRIETEGWSLQAIWLTHAHLDHIMGVAPIVRATGVPVYLHPADRPLYDGAADQGAWLGFHAEAPPPPDHALRDDDVLHLGALSFTVVHVPGHSPGSVALVGHGIAIVGDALFAGSVGRTDLPGGDAATLMRSIHERLLSLPDSTVVYAGHGPATTIGEERRSNPFLTGVHPLA
jgi:hydroxyacylglutathione hydrolase